LARTHHFATIQNVTDRQTTDDRQTRYCTKGSTDSTVGQKMSGRALTWLCVCSEVQICIWPS